jgi:hypothetical protein
MVGFQRCCFSWLVKRIYAAPLFSRGMEGFWAGGIMLEVESPSGKAASKGWQV